MKSRISSLSKNEDFKNLLSGRKIANQYSTIFFKKISSKNNKFLNVSFVTKKKIGNAVKRNKIKRRLRNIMNDANKKISINVNYSYLVIAKENILRDEYKEKSKVKFRLVGRAKYPTKSYSNTSSAYLTAKYYVRSPAGYGSLGFLRELSLC